MTVTGWIRANAMEPLTNNLDMSPMLTMDLANGFLESNIAALGLGGHTLDLVTRAKAHGAVTYLPDLTPVIRYGSETLGVPPDESVIRSRAQQADADDSVLVVFGLGFGHTVRRLRAYTQRPILVFEPDPGLLRCTLLEGPTDLGGLDVVCSVQDLKGMWKRVAKQAKIATIVRTPGYEAAFPSELETLHRALVDLVQRSGSNEVTHDRRARTWVRDVIENVDLLVGRSPFMALAGCFPGVPAFIVGAGPSLSKNVAMLAEASAKGLVIAVNSSSWPLAKNGIEPHVLACIESIDLSHLLKDLPYLDRCIRAFSLAASPKTLRTGSGPLLPVYESLPIVGEPLRQLTGLPGLPVCGSVSTVAFSLAQRLGCNPIVLVGHDLAYTDGEVYARGTPYEGSRATVSKDKKTLDLEWAEPLVRAHEAAGGSIGFRDLLQEIPGWGGSESVHSGANFCATRDWLGDAAQLLVRTAPDLRLINATEGGAHVPGFEDQTLDALLQSLPNLDLTVKDILEIQSQRASPMTVDGLVAWVEMQLKQCENSRRVARRLHRIARVGIEAVKRGKPGEVRRVYAALELAENKFREVISLNRMLEAWSHTEIGQVTRDKGPTEDAQRGASAAMRQEVAVAAAIEVSAKELQQELTALGQRLGQSSRA